MADYGFSLTRTSLRKDKIKDIMRKNTGIAFAVYLSRFNGLKNVDIATKIKIKCLK